MGAPLTAGTPPLESCCREIEDLIIDVIANH